MTIRCSHILDGVMLGDGRICFSRNNPDAYFQMNLSGSKTMIYLEYLKQALIHMGIHVSQNYPKLYPAVSRGKPYALACLATSCSSRLTAEQPRWYLGRKGQKIVPADIELSPVTLAHWFMGDGSSSKGACGCINTTLCTDSFPKECVEILETCLHGISVNTGREHRHVKEGSGIRLTILQSSVNNFMHMIDPYVVEPYRYKIKYRNDDNRECASISSGSRVNDHKGSDCWRLRPIS